MPRPRKSEAEKAAQGTLQPCRQRHVSLSTFSLTAEPPVNLTKDARAAWETAVACAPKGVLTALDATVLERWARNYALYRKIAKEIERSDLVIESEKGMALNPVFNALVKIQQVLAACEKELGFTPVSRARVNGTGETEEANDFDGF